MISAGLFPRIGGVEAQLRGLSASLLRRGLDVHILTRDFNGEPPDDPVDGVPVHRVRLIHPSRALASLSFLIGGSRWLWRQRGCFDILHCHQAYSPLTLAVLAKRPAGNPRVVVKVTTAGALSEMNAVTRELPFRRLRKQIIKQVDAFVAISGEIAAEIESAGISPARIVRIPNGVAIPAASGLSSEARSRARAALGLPFRRVAVFVGRLASEKGLLVLAEAFKEILAREPDAGLLLVGEGGGVRSVEAELRQRVRELGIDGSVRFTGPMKDVSPALAAADVFVLPSFTEGMSNAALESMAFALPAVVSDIPGNRELITHGENGLLVPPGDVGALARAVLEVLASRARAESMGRVSRLKAENEFSFGRVAERYLRLYSGLMENSAPKLTVPSLGMSRYS
jgi:glycosyltransferase involved in cell wall biosynthesis